MYLTFSLLVKYMLLVTALGMQAERGSREMLALISLSATCLFKFSHRKASPCYPDPIPEAECESAASTVCTKEPEIRRDRTPVFLFYLPPHPSLTIHLLPLPLPLSVPLPLLPLSLSLGVAVGFVLGQGLASQV